MLPSRAKVYSADKKDIGEVSSINGDYFVSFKQGLVVDEEYRIPLKAIEGVLPSSEEMIVEVGLNEEQLKHGYEVVEERTGSDLIKGKSESELKLPTGKQLIRYSAMEYYRRVRLDRTKGNIPSGYACDMCNAKFDKAGALEKHRMNIHKGPIGL
jgi:hypothetical protein